MAPVTLIVHHPKTAEGRKELARCAAEVHADAVNQQLKALNCPASQKAALLEAVLQAVRSQNGEQV